MRRWFEVHNATLNLRYRLADNSAGDTVTNQVQHRETLKGRFNVDKSARYTLNFGISTGTNFTSGWDNTGLGMRDPQKSIAFRAVYFAVSPGAGVEVQSGGLDITRGESTELTSYDEDGYVTGHRVSLRRPHHLYVDDISATLAYLTSDSREIPISKRAKYLNDTPNYRHFLVGKTLGRRAAVSADFTYAAGARTWRQAVRLKTPELLVVDKVVFENYQRINHSPDQGFALTLDKTLHRRVSVNGGYASIDPRYGGLNSYRFQVGNRAFGMVSFGISRQILASAFFTRAVGNDIPLSQRTLMNLVVTYNVLPDLKRTGWF